ncbi:MAG: type II secretion system F family protein [Candidatus Sungbacteria bacterium]|uniref:Type II secretion system F family protein n=1 Tax=Candidatus Sungiibacteriota bacterium TaxID=2750080 RepID=A0A932YW50_9BACT|nr:type II secretion system F family protein [Candidatus Sungbacteria bacterium]
MAQFTYKARTPEGEARSGVVEARSLDAAIEVLQRSNLIVTEIRPQAAPALLGRRISFFDRVKQRDVVIFSRQLSTLFEAKVPMTQSLRTLAAETESLALRDAVGEVLDDVSGGSSLSQALGRHTGIFSAFYISMVRAGEESGKLEEVFRYLADYLERSYALASKARNALMYPAFVLVAFIGVIIVMLVVVVPRLTSIFAELGQQVPFYTRVIIAISSFLQHWGIAVLILVAIAAIAAWRYTRTAAGALILDSVKIRLPIVGGLLQKIYLTRLADNLSTLIVAGIPIIRALEITGDVVANRVYQRIIADAAESVKAGNTISASFDRYGEIPPLITQMIRIGEESGKLDFILKSAAGFYRRDVDNLLENFVSLIEPALIIFLGLGVGMLVAAVLVPLYNLSSIL